MSDIYEQHKAAFANVSAYVVLNAARERVATIAFKFPRDGAGRLYAYVHWFGLQMARGFATGGGYDKRSAACSSAAGRVTGLPALPDCDHAEVLKFRDALLKDDGHSWERNLEAAGFTVLQAV
jgi:hypothetical protein